MQYLLSFKLKGRNNAWQKYICQFLCPHLSSSNGLVHLNQLESFLLFYVNYWGLMVTESGPEARIILQPLSNNLQNKEI